MNDSLFDMTARLNEREQAMSPLPVLRHVGELVPKLLLLCAAPDYSTEDMVADKPDVARQWSEDLNRQGWHVTVDAIELSLNAAGGFKGVDGHESHPHVALTCFAAQLPGRN